MKKLFFLLFLTNIAVAQKKVSIIITGYDQVMDKWESSNVNFVDTSYYEIPDKAWTVLTKDSIYYPLYTEVKPQNKQDFTLINFYHYTDYWGSQSFENSYPVLFYIVRQKLISLGKM